jgi:hypothetical protein
MRWFRRNLTSLVAAAGLLAPLPVFASPALPPVYRLTLQSAPANTPSAEDEAAGRRHYKKGDELFKQGRFLDAAREFEAGYAAAPRPLFLLNIGHSYRKAQELRKARAAYEEYLKTDPTSTFRADVEDLIKTIDDALAASALPSAPPPPTTPPPTSSLPPVAPVPSSAGPVNTGTIDLAPPVLVNVDHPPPAPAESKSIFRSPWFWGAVGVVVAAGVAGTVYGLSRSPACPATRCLREAD